MTKLQKRTGEGETHTEKSYQKFGDEWWLVPRRSRLSAWPHWTAASLTARSARQSQLIPSGSCYFSYILNFLRTSELTLPCDFKETELLRKEADFYQIEPLIQCLGDPKPLLHYPTDTYEEVLELSSTRKLSKYSNPVAVIITQLTITTKVSES